MSEQAYDTAEGLYDEIDGLRAMLAIREKQIGALIWAGDRLAEGYATHDEDCPYPLLAVVTDEDCSCGLNAAREAWDQAKEDR